MSVARAVVLLGTPFTALDAWGKRLADAIGGVWLGDLNVSMAITVGELLQLHEVAQIDLQEPLYALLKRTLPEAGVDPDGYLEQRADWSIARLIAELRSRIGKPVVLSDVSASFRIHQVERWFAMLPDALFVHVTSELPAFVEAATRFYSGQLYVPPDYRDHCIEHPTAPVKPELAWYQVHMTVSRAFGDNPSLRRCRLPLESPPPSSLPALDELGATQADSDTFRYPFATKIDAAAAPTLPALVQWLGHAGTR